MSKQFEQVLTEVTSGEDKSEAFFTDYKEDRLLITNALASFFLQESKLQGGIFQQQKIEQAKKLLDQAESLSLVSLHNFVSKIFYFLFQGRFQDAQMNVNQANIKQKGNIMAMIGEALIKFNCGEILNSLRVFKKILS